MNTIDTIDLLRGIVNPTTNFLTVLGYYESGDGGGGNFYWDSTSIEADNDGTIIKTTSINTGRWIRMIEDFVTPKMFGVKLDNQDDSSFFQKCLNFAGDNNLGVRFYENSTLLTASQILIPAGLKFYDCPNLTIKQMDNSNLSSVVTTGNFGNTYGYYNIKIDGNISANSTSSLCFKFGGIAAGNRFKFDFSFSNCEKGLLIDREIEHSNFDIYARDCENVVIIDTQNESSDENSFRIWSWRTSCIFKTIGTTKSSGMVEFYCEQNDGWVADLSNGWFSFSGIARSTGKKHGGGIRLASSVNRIMFSNLQLYGDPDNYIDETIGLLCESSSCDVNGEILLGIFDKTCWLKEYGLKADLRIIAAAAPRNGETLKLGDFSNSLRADGGTFSIDNSGGATNFPGLNLDYASNVSVNIPTYLKGGTNAEDILISSESYDNIIEIGRRMIDASITNNQTNNNNVISYKGSYSKTDLTYINGGQYIRGMQVQEYYLTSSIKMPGYYDGALDKWLTTSGIWESGTAVISANSTTILVSNDAIADAITSLIVTPVSSLGTATKWWVSNRNNSSFTINLDSQAGSDVTFNWSINRVV